MMDCVILAGTVGPEAGWTFGQPRPLLPLPHTTLIEALVTGAGRRAGGACVVCANGHTEVIARHLARNGSAGGHVGFFEDCLPRGTGGCLKSCAPQLSGAPILVVGGSVFLDDEPEALLQHHKAHGNALTVFCRRDSDMAGPGVKTPLRPLGVYCCDPDVLDFIHPRGFQDLKEQVIPALKEAGRRVGAVHGGKATRQVADWRSYIAVLDQVLSAGRFDTAGYTAVSPGVWRGEDVTVAPGARIAGPALLGRGSRIGAGATLVGPVILGDECQIGDASWVVRVVAADRTGVPGGVSIADTFLSRPAAAGHGADRLKGLAVTPPVARGRLSRPAMPELTLLGGAVWGWGSAVMRPAL